MTTILTLEQIKHDKGLRFCIFICYFYFLKNNNKLWNEFILTRMQKNIILHSTKLFHVITFKSARYIRIKVTDKLIDFLAVIKLNND